MADEETLPLLVPHEGCHHNNSDERKDSGSSGLTERPAKAAFIFLHVMLVFALLGYAGLKYGGEISPVKLQKEVLQWAGINSRLHISNKYIDLYGPPGERYPWLRGKYLAEPFVDHTLRVAEGLDEFARYEWEVFDGEESFFFAGRSVHFRFKKVNQVYGITVRRLLIDGKVVGTSKFEVEVKYVRREIRSLTPDDRDELLDAMVQLWELETNEGQKLYGKDYLSVHDLLKIHLVSTADHGCDFMHAGMGFLAQHSALGYLFEKSIQAINPTLALPYWDYTKDMEYFLRERAGDFTKFHEMELLTPDYFGETDLDTHQLKNGRWAEYTIPKMTPEDYQHNLPHNAFGFLRSPWNANANARITRSFDLCGSNPSDTFQMSDCESYQNLLNMGKWSEFAHQLPLQAHAGVHIALGGTYHCKETYDTLESHFPVEVVQKMRGFSFVVYRNLFLKNILQCPDCDESTVLGGQCTCSCPNLDEVTASSNGLAQVIRQSKIDKVVPDILGFDSSSLRIYLQSVCDSGMVNGESLQSSSPMTPEFWLIHPNLERLYQWKKIAYPFESEEADSLPEDDHCMGTNPDDYVLQQHYKNSERTGITNKDLRAILDPHRANGLSYIYDSFGWDHCKNYGYTMFE